MSIQMFSLEQLKARHSVRAFEPRQIDRQTADELQKEVDTLNSRLPQGVRFSLIFENNRPFKGFRRSYGMFHNARNYLVVTISEITDPDTLFKAKEEAGYYAQHFVMKCLSLGIGSCFVGGTFDPGECQLESDIKAEIPFVVVFGYPAENKSTLIARISHSLSHLKKRMPESFLQNGDYERACRTYPRLPEALQAVACAPSAMNKQPVRVTVSADGQVGLTVISNDRYSPIDLGIARFNFDCMANKQLK